MKKIVIELNKNEKLIIRREQDDYDLFPLDMAMIDFVSDSMSITLDKTVTELIISDLCDSFLKVKLGSSDIEMDVVGSLYQAYNIYTYNIYKNDISNEISGLVGLEEEKWFRYYLFSNTSFVTWIYRFNGDVFMRIDPHFASELKLFEKSDNQEKYFLEWMNQRNNISVISIDSNYFEKAYNCCLAYRKRIGEYHMYLNDDPFMNED